MQMSEENEDRPDRLPVGNTGEDEDDLSRELLSNVAGIAEAKGKSNGEGGGPGTEESPAEDRRRREALDNPEYARKEVATLKTDILRERHKLIVLRRRSAPMVLAVALLALITALLVMIASLDATERPKYENAMSAARASSTLGAAWNKKAEDGPSFAQLLEREQLQQAIATTIYESQLQHRDSLVIARVLLIFSLFGLAAAFLRSFHVLTQTKAEEAESADGVSKGILEKVLDAALKKVQ
jgi:uncharacterized protein (DUF736 family)